MENSIQLEKCLICETLGGSSRNNSVLKKIVRVPTRGIQNLIQVSEQKEDNFKDHLIGKATIFVHDICRENYTSLDINMEEDLELLSDTEDSDEYCDEDSGFDWDNYCILCAKKLNTKKLGKKAIFTVTSSISREKILNRIQEFDSQQKSDIYRRISSEDLVSRGAKYHKKCFSVIHLKDDVNLNDPEIVEKIEKTMHKLYDYFENNKGNKVTFRQIYRKILDKNDYKPEEDVINKNLVDHFGDEKMIVMLNDPKIGWTYLLKSDNASHGMNDSESSQLFLPENKKIILDACIQIINADIKNIGKKPSTKPKSADLSEKKKLVINGAIEIVRKEMGETQDVSKSLQYILDGIMKPPPGASESDLKIRKMQCDMIANMALFANCPDSDVAKAPETDAQKISKMVWDALDEIDDDLIADCTRYLKEEEKKTNQPMETNNDTEI